MLERIEINLLPAEYRIHLRQATFVQSEILYPAVAFVLVAFILGWWTVALRSDIDEYTLKIADAEGKIAQYKQIEEDINTVKQQKIVLEQKIHALQLISVDREKWVRMQELFCSMLPSITWLERLEEKPDSSAAIILEGKTYSFAEVGQYMSQLRVNPSVGMISLKSIEQVQGRQNTYRFALECIMNPDSIFTASVIHGKKMSETY